MKTTTPGFSLRALNGEFGIEPQGVHASMPLAPTAQALRAAIERHRVLMLRGQKLAPAAHVAFSRLFRELEIEVLDKCHKASCPEIFELSNWRAGDLVMRDNRATLHCGTGYDTAFEPRVVRRTVVSGEAVIAC